MAVIQMDLCSKLPDMHTEEAICLPTCTPADSLNVYRPGMKYQVLGCCTAATAAL